MKRIEVYAVGILLALVPAVFGLWGNASFSRDVPVRIPDQARATTAVAGVDMRQVQAAHHAGVTPAEHHHGRHGADDPATHDVGDDHGGDRSGPSSDDRSGPSGVDRSGRSGGGGGADDPVNHDVNDDRGGATGASGTSGGGGADDTSGHSGGDSGSGSGTSGSGGGKGSGGGSDD